MNKQIKLLVILFIIAFFGVSFFAAGNASAQTNEQIIQQLQEKIMQLKAQIVALQVQLGIVSPGKPEPVPVSILTPLSSECPTFSHTLYRGVSDASTGGEVTKLQKTLAEDPSVYPEGLVTGYYGSLTEKAVQRWQTKQGVISSGSAATTGYGVVGAQTRVKIAAVCPMPTPKPIPIPIPTDNITVLSPNSGEQWALGSNQLIQWVSGPIAYVDIDLLSLDVSCDPCFSAALARKMPNNSSFFWTVGKNIPGSIIPTGPYVIRISNSENTSQYDQSDKAFNIVKERSGKLPPTISGVSGPSVLKVGEVGKWEVKATDPELGSLTYSVVWGDETVGIGIAERAISSAPSAIIQTATFTHVYSVAGLYNPTFTVTDNGGLSAKTSVSVSVSSSPTTNNPPVINGIPTIPSDIKVGQSISFGWSATDADYDNLSWSVSWGDGTGEAGACQSPNPQNKAGWTYKTSHAWQKAGTYTVKATVNDCRGGSDEYAFNVTVGNTGSGQTIIKKVGEQEGSFLIQKINPASVDGLWYESPPAPVSPTTSSPKTLHIGDDIGYACQGVSEKLTSIDFPGQTVTFTKIIIISDLLPYGCPICLAENTLIDTPSGSVSVQNLQVGMPVWTANKDGQRVAAVVVKTSKVAVPPTHQMIHLVLDDGRGLFVSPGHPTTDGRTVEKLVLGDSYDGAHIIAVDRVAYSSTATYDILPSGETGFYWANGILVGTTLR